MISLRDRFIELAHARISKDQAADSHEQQAQRDRSQLPSALATDQRQLGEQERQPTHRQSVPRDNLELTSQHDRRLPSRRCQSRRCRTRISRRTSRKKLTPIRNVLLQVQVHLIRRRKRFGASSSVAKTYRRHRHPYRHRHRLRLRFRLRHRYRY